MGGLALGLAGAPALAHPNLDFNDPVDRLTALAKLRGSTDERLVVGWVIGTRYAVIEHKATPMYGILAATFSQYKKINDEAYGARALEVAYFTDLENGRLLETWKNPFSGVTVEIPQTRMGPSSLILTAEGLRVDIPQGEAAGMQLNHRFRAPVVHGDHVWVTEEINVAGTPPHAGAKPFVYNEMSTYHALKSHLDDPERANVPVSVDFHGLVTFRPWMGFGDIPGHTTARAAGRRAERIEDLPGYYLELTERYHADVLNDPLGLLNTDGE
jgi:hypothetical protein